MTPRPRTYVALLRGVNLGARNKIAMPDLRDLLVALGCEDIATYVQSGNAVFRSRADPAELAGTIEDRIRHDLGLGVTVVMRTGSQLAEVARANPYAEEQNDPTKLLVTFLAETPARARVRALDPGAFAPDEFRVAGREVYLHCPNGYGRTKLSNAFFERQLEVAGTTRNWKTVRKLAELTAVRGGARTPAE
jgi:uncharacterized protein (DUF1697 family)